MIKNRSFMIGLGSGLVAGALLLQLMNSAGAAVPTKEQVVRDAAKLNLKVSEQSEKLLTEEEWAALQEQGSGEDAKTDTGAPAEPAAVKSPAPAEAPEGAASPDTAASPANPSPPGDSAVKTPAVTPASAPTSSDPTGNEITLRVPNGSTLRDVADLLALGGIIKDTGAFLREGNSRGIAKNIQYGKYSFKKGESLDSIFKKLTTVK
jgi:hypothetical protein